MTCILRGKHYARRNSFSAMFVDTVSWFVSPGDAPRRDADLRARVSTDGYDVLEGMDGPDPDTIYPLVIGRSAAYRKSPLVVQEGVQYFVELRLPPGHVPGQTDPACPGRRVLGVIIEYSPAP